MCLDGMLSDKMTLSALFWKQLACLGLSAGSPKTPLCLDWIIWQVASSRLLRLANQEEDYAEYQSLIPLHCLARLRACADSNIETSRQKTFVRLNKVVRGKEFDREEWRMCV